MLERLALTEKDLKKTHINEYLITTSSNLVTNIPTRLPTNGSIYLEWKTYYEDNNHD